MPSDLIVYTDELGKWLWENCDLLEARRTSNEEEGFTIPITISDKHIVHETDEDIIDIKRTARS